MHFHGSNFHNLLRKNQQITRIINIVNIDHHVFEKFKMPTAQSLLTHLKILFAALQLCYTISLCEHPSAFLYFHDCIFMTKSYLTSCHY